MAGAERRLPADPDLAELRDWARSDRQNQRRQLGLVIDDYLLLADRRRGEAFLSQRLVERDPGGNDFLGDDRVAFAHGEAVTQRLIILARRLESRELDRSEAVLGSRIDLEQHFELGARAFDPRLDGGVIIAVAAQDLPEQLGVGARAAADLGGVGGLLAALFQRRLLAEGLEQGGLVAKPLESLDDEAVANVVARTVVLFGRYRRRWQGGLALAWRHRLVGRVEIGPVDPEIGQRGHRRRGVELAGIEAVLRRAKGRHGEGGNRRAEQPRGPPGHSPPMHEARD